MLFVHHCYLFSLELAFHSGYLILVSSSSSSFFFSFLDL